MENVKTRILQKYDSVAYRYDLVEAIPGILGITRLRKDVIRQATGEIVEVAAGGRAST